AVTPGFSCANVTVLLLPVPPHTPPCVAVHETYWRPTGRLSCTTMPLPGSALRLRTVIVKVTLWFGRTVVALAFLVSARSTAYPSFWMTASRSPPPYVVCSASTRRKQPRLASEYGDE